MPRVTTTLERKNAFSNRMTGKRKFVDEPVPSGMSAEDMKAFRRYANNMLCLLIEPTLEQMEELLPCIDEIRAKLT
jgi:hypothetical protein